MILTRILILLSLVLMLTVLVTANSTSDVFADKPDRIDFRYNGPGGFLTAFDKNNVPYTTTPDGDQTGVAVSDGDIVQVTAGTSPPTDKAPEFSTESYFYVDGTELLVVDTADDQTPGDNLHTSCSKELLVEITMVAAGSHKLTVTNVLGSTDPECVPAMIGGTGFSIEKSALLISGMKTTGSWMIPVLLASAGFAIIIARKF